jgi:NAD(P)-dependent dehydrogenase (short-subunit alcohol dehydrogenase family)
MTPTVEARVDPKVLAGVAERTPLRYIGDPYRDIAPVVVFLAGDAARYVTGQTINVDGGMWMF